MKAILLPALFTFALSATLPAEICREVVRDSSGRIFQTVERHKQAGGSVQSVTRDASGRLSGSETTQSNGTMTSTKRDASGRLIGSSSGSGSCSPGTRLPAPTMGAKK